MDELADEEPHPALPNQKRSAPAFFLVLLLLLAQPAARGAESLADDVEFFEASVRPLLVEKCWSCHGPSGKIKGGLRLVSRASILKGGDSGPAAVAGDPSASLLVQATRYDHDPKMPPAGKLPDRQIDALARWVAMGLPWPETKPAPSSPAAGRAAATDAEPSRRFWSFKPVHDVPVPAGPDSELARSPIDRFLLHELQKHALSFAGPADKRTLIRRATFDLTGLPPTPEEIDAFLADDSPDAFAQRGRSVAGVAAVRRALGPALARRRPLRRCPRPDPVARRERFPRILALSRLGRRGIQSRHALHRFHPLPARRRLAAPAPSPAGSTRTALVATGMLAIADFVPGDVDKDQMIADYVNDEIDVVARAFLGLSVACARCHDHKFDPDLHRRLLCPGRHLLQHPADPGARARQHPAHPRAAAFAGRAETARGQARGRRQAPASRARAAASRRGRPARTSPC